MLSIIIIWGVKGTESTNPLTMVMDSTAKAVIFRSFLKMPAAIIENIEKPRNPVSVKI